MSQRIPDRASGMSIRTHAERLRKRDPVLAEALTIIQSGVDQLEREVRGMCRLDSAGGARVDMSRAYRDSMAPSVTVRADNTFGVAPGGVGDDELANAPIITAVRIGAAAVQDLHFDRASGNKIQVRNADIDRATANKLVVVDADIASLSAAKITAGYLAAARLDTTVAYISNQAMISNAVIKTAHIGDLQVTGAKIAELTIESTKIANATIVGAKIATGTITSANIANATITNAEIADATITGAKIANATIGTAHISSLSADKITTGTMSVGSGGLTVNGIGGVIVQYSIQAGGSVLANTAVTTPTVNATTKVQLNGWDVIDSNRKFWAYGGLDVNSKLSVAATTGDLATAGYVSAALFKYLGTLDGITGTRTVKDGSGNNKTVTISGGIITGWET